MRFHVAWMICVSMMLVVVACPMADGAASGEGEGDGASEGEGEGAIVLSPEEACALTPVCPGGAFETDGALAVLDGCRVVDGPITVAPGVTSLIALSDLTCVRGDVFIGAAVATLAPLSNLVAAAGMTIDDADLTSLSSLSSLQSLRRDGGNEVGNLTLRNLAQLESLRGIEALREVGFIGLSEMALRRQRKARSS
jgi:hypothetical protein